MFKRKLVIASYIVVALGLSACSNGEVNKEETPVEENTNNNDTVDNTNTNTSDVDTVDKGTSTSNITEDYDEIKISATDAYNTFLEKKPNSNIEKIALDYNNNKYSYKIEGYDDLKEYELEIDALNKEILRLEEDDRDDEKLELTLADVEKIDSIVNNAISENHDFLSVEWELSIKNDRKLLEIEFDKKDNDIDYKYDLNTGELLEKDK